MSASIQRRDVKQRCRKTVLTSLDVSYMVLVKFGTRIELSES